MTLIIALLQVLFYAIIFCAAALAAVCIIAAGVQIGMTRALENRKWSNQISRMWAGMWAVRCVTACARRAVS